MRNHVIMQIKSSALKRTHPTLDESQILWHNSKASTWWRSNTSFIHHPPGCVTDTAPYVKTSPSNEGKSYFKTRPISLRRYTSPPFVQKGHLPLLPPSTSLCYRLLHWWHYKLARFACQTTDNLLLALMSLIPWCTYTNKKHGIPTQKENFVREFVVTRIHPNRFILVSKLQN